MTMPIAFAGQRHGERTASRSPALPMDETGKGEVQRAQGADMPPAPHPGKRSGVKGSIAWALSGCVGRLLDGLPRAGEEPVQRLDQEPWRPIHETSLAGAVTATQKDIEGPAEVAVIVVVGQTRPKLAVQRQQIEDVLQV